MWHLAGSSNTLNPVKYQVFGGCIALQENTDYLKTCASQLYKITLIEGSKQLVHLIEQIQKCFINVRCAKSQDVETKDLLFLNV